MIMEKWPRWLKNLTVGSAVFGSVMIGNLLGFSLYQKSLPHKNDEEREKVVKQYLEEDFTNENMYDEISRMLEDNGVALTSKYKDQFLTEKKYSALNTTEINSMKSVLEGLESKTNKNRIGKLIKKDLTYGEHTKVKGFNAEGEQGEFYIDGAKTELGGLLKWDDGLEIVPYEPASQNDNTSYTTTYHRNFDPCIATFHLHAIYREGNPESEGPSMNDFKMVKRYNKPGVVFTYLGTDQNNEVRFNADFYQEDGLVIDLGTYSTEVGLEPYLDDI